MSQPESPNSPSPMSRRSFLVSSSAALVAAGRLASPASAVEKPSRPPSNVPPEARIPMAGIGIGGVGFGQLKEFEWAGFNIVALCDVDQVYAKKAFDQWPSARRYRDYREMLRTEGDKISAVHVATPDHTHALIALAAMRAGKNVCCVKPLTRTIEECRAVVAAAKKTGVVTQVTAAPNTSEVACRTCELIQGGAIGTVREVHIWSNRPLWPQGMRPPLGEEPVPDTFDWNLWIGPARMRPFKSHWSDEDYPIQQVNLKPGRKPESSGVYHPWNFRGWWDFGTGAIGDMGCHHLNTPFRALNLQHPRYIQAVSTKTSPETPPLASMITYDFPASGSRAPVRVIWYDGGMKPPVPAELGQRMLPVEGVLYLGDEGKMIGPKLLSPERAAKFETLPRTLIRRGGTWVEFYQACRGGEAPGCPFDWAGLLTETVLLGNIAVRTGRPLEWDAPNMRFINDEPANEFLKASYQNGWSLDA